VVCNHHHGTDDRHFLNSAGGAPIISQNLRRLRLSSSGHRA